MNTKYYSEKNKRSTDERLPQSHQPLKESVQPVNEKGSVVEHKEELNQEDLIKKIESIYTKYQEKINDFGQLTSIGKKKIANRLRMFTDEELIKVIDNFSRNKWCMDNNARRGVAWFFDNNERIDQFLSFPRSKFERFESIKSHKIDSEYDSITIKA